MEITCSDYLRTNNKDILKALQVIPGVGPSIASDLYLIGIRRANDLIGKDPEKLYNRLNKVTNAIHDICILYVFRCAVYFASSGTHEKEKLNWWYWKNHSI